jgi:hypothetical protein
MKEVFYKKVGRKYVPVSEYDSTLLDALPKGAHLVLCYPGGRSTRYNINPDFAPMMAAGRYAEEAISKSLMASSELRPATWDKFTEKEKRMWDAIKSCIPKQHRYMYTHGSAYDAVQAGVKAMSVEAETMLENPAVRKAYERFMLVCQLAKDHTKKENHE